MAVIFCILDLASPAQTHDLYLSLISILFAYMYDVRTTQHDRGPESAWTLCNLIPAFSALDPPRFAKARLKETDETVVQDTELISVFVSSYRRLLVFPLYRSYALADACKEDVATVFAQGKRAVLRCLLETKDILDHHEAYYIYSKIWIDDFCVWLQAYAS